MPDSKNYLYLYEALELRREYEKRLNYLETFFHNPTDTKVVMSYNENYTIESQYDRSKFRDSIQLLETKKRKINSAIQQLNHNTKIDINNETMSLSEALYLRKLTIKKITELKDTLKTALYSRIIYKEERTIEEPPVASFKKLEEELELNLLLFRELNRKLRRATYEKTVNFANEL